MNHFHQNCDLEARHEITGEHRNGKYTYNTYWHYYWCNDHNVKVCRCGWEYGWHYGRSAAEENFLANLRADHIRRTNYARTLAKKQ